jgi:hypothetical protein
MPPRKRDRFKAWLRESAGTTKPSARIEESDTPTSPQGPQGEVDPPKQPAQSFAARDNRLSNERFKVAQSLLDETVKGCGSKLGMIGFPEFENKSESPSLSGLVHILDSRKDTVQNQSLWSKCTEALAVSFKALSPFIKTFLEVASQGQSV